MRNKPDVTLVQVCEWTDGKVRRLDDLVATEEPLDIRIGARRLGISLRTPGNDRDLVAGLLFTEGLISDIAELSRVDVADGATSEKQRSGSHAVERNVARARLRPGVTPSTRVVRRGFSAGSACGACGKASIAALQKRGVRAPSETACFNPEMLCALPEKLREAQAVFGRTGGLHAAALFDRQGELLVVREDIGRHNAVDKVIGWSLLEKRTLRDCAMLVSGRGGFEIVTKAIVAGIPVLASVSAPSSLAVQMAREMGLTLIGFLRGRRFIIYAHEHRLLTSPI